MADISTYLEQIKSAVYGEEVRSAIHDSIELCYEEAQNSSGNGSSTTTYYTVTQTLTNCATSNTTTKVASGRAWKATYTPDYDVTLNTPVVTMGGADITDDVWDADSNTITISAVTGTVVITVTASAGDVDTSPVVSISGYGINTSLVNTADERLGICTFDYQYDTDAMKASSYYDSDNNYMTLNGVLGIIVILTPTTNLAENGGSTSGITSNNKIAYSADGTRFNYSSNNSYSSGTAVNVQTPRYCSKFLTAETITIEIPVILEDIENSYAYWTTNNDAAILPDGVEKGDIIFAGKNTDYYQMKNIDGTMASANEDVITIVKEAASETDSDVSQDYTETTASILGSSVSSDAATAYGISQEVADTLEETKNQWMIEYGGDYRKIPLIITVDQHGRTSAGLFRFIGKVFSMYDLSKVCNLGDTVSVEWIDGNSDHELLSDATLAAWNETMEYIPKSKQLNVFGNHDTWYYNGYSDEDNSIGTRYPASLAHLNQYFRNIYATRKTNNGWFATVDPMFNVKYVVVSGYEAIDGTRTSTTKISTAQMNWLIDELSKDDGYDIVTIAHEPLYWNSETVIDPVGDNTYNDNMLRFSEINTDDLFNARKNKGSGTITDSEGVEHSYDFSNCSTPYYCHLHGHIHADGYDYVGDSETGVLNVSFDWFPDMTVHFVLVDRANECVNVWKYDSTMTEAVNYQIPFDK